MNNQLKPLDKKYKVPHVKDSHRSQSEHTGNEPHNHYHTHPHQNTKAVLNRLSKANGHLGAIIRMIESGKDCTEVLIQLAAVKSAINNAGKIILEDHIDHCIVAAVENGDEQAIVDLNKAIKSFF